MAKAGGIMRGSLSSRLLLWTVCFVMVVEVFVYVPSVAHFRRSFIEQRLQAAHIASLSLAEAPGQAVSSNLEQTLLDAAGVKAVSLNLEDGRRLVLSGKLPADVDVHYDMRNVRVSNLILDALATLARRGKSTIQVSNVLQSGLQGQTIAIIMKEDALF